MRLIKINSKCAILVAAISLLLILFASNIRAGVIKLNSLDGVPYIPVTIIIEEQKIPVNFIFDIGLDSPVVFLDAYDKYFESVNEDGYVIELENGETFIFNEYDSVKCTDFMLGSLNKFSEKEMPLGGYVGGSLFGDKYLYDNVNNELIVNDTPNVLNECLAVYDYSVGDKFFSLNESIAGYGAMKFGLSSVYYQSQYSNINDESEFLINEDSLELAFGSFSLQSAGQIVGIDQSYIEFDIVLGNQFLDNYYIYVDKTAKRISFYKSESHKYDVSYSQYLTVISSNDPMQILDFMEKHKDLPYINKASEKLFDCIVLSQSVDAELFERYLVFIISIFGPEKAISDVLEMVDCYVADVSKYPVLEVILNVCKKYSILIEEYSILTNEIDYKTGVVYLNENKLEEAHLQLLSSLFGQPQNVFYNFAVGKLQLKKGLHLRAKARFKNSRTYDMYGDLYPEQLETVTNDLQFVNNFMSSDDRPKYITTLANTVGKEYDLNSFDISKISIIEIYQRGNKLLNTKFSDAMTQILRYRGGDNLLVLNYQASDGVDCIKTTSNRFDLNELTKDEPFIVFVNGVPHILNLTHFANERNIIYELVGGGIASSPIILDSYYNNDNHTISMELSDLIDEAASCEIHYFNGYSCLEYSSINLEWDHRNILFASKTVNVSGNIVIIDSLPYGFHIWPKYNNMANEEKTKLKSDNGIFIGHSFAVLKIYDTSNNLVGYSKINFLTGENVYYEYF